MTAEWSTVCINPTLWLGSSLLAIATDDGLAILNLPVPLQRDCGTLGNAMAWCEEALRREALDILREKPSTLAADQRKTQALEELTGLSDDGQTGSARRAGLAVGAGPRPS